MHVTGFWSAVGAVITGLIVADLLYHWKGTVAIGRNASSFGTKTESSLAGRR